MDRKSSKLNAVEAGTDTHSYLEHALSRLVGGIPVAAPSDAAQQVETKLLETLDPGEAQALTVAETAGGLVVTDDGDARVVAKERGVG